MEIPISKSRQHLPTLMAICIDTPSGILTGYFSSVRFLPTTNLAELHNIPLWINAITNFTVFEGPLTERK